MPVDGSFPRAHAVRGNRDESHRRKRVVTEAGIEQRSKRWSIDTELASDTTFPRMILGMDVAFVDTRVPIRRRIDVGSVYSEVISFIESIFLGNSSTFSSENRNRVQKIIFPAIFL